MVIASHTIFGLDQELWFIVAAVIITLVWLLITRALGSFAVRRWHGNGRLPWLTAVMLPLGLPLALYYTMFFSSYTLDFYLPRSWFLFTNPLARVFGYYSPVASVGFPVIYGSLAMAIVWHRARTRPESTRVVILAGAIGVGALIIAGVINSWYSVGLGFLVSVALSLASFPAGAHFAPRILASSAGEAQPPAPRVDQEAGQQPQTLRTTRVVLRRRK